MTDCTNMTAEEDKSANKDIDFSIMTPDEIDRKKAEAEKPQKIDVALLSTEELNQRYVDKEHEIVMAGDADMTVKLEINAIGKIVDDARLKKRELEDAHIKSQNVLRRLRSERDILKSELIRRNRK